MVALAGLVAVLAMAGVLMLGLWLEYGWLTVLGMLGMGAVVVVWLTLPAPRYQEPAPSARRAPLSMKEVALPASGMTAIAAAGLAMGIGLWLEWGWLTVLGMLLVGMAMVAALVRASRPGQGRV